MMRTPRFSLQMLLVRPALTLVDRSAETGQVLSRSVVKVAPAPRIAGTRGEKG